MSKKSLRISVSKRVFNEYPALVIFIKESLSKQIKMDNSFKHETIRLLNSFKDMLVNGQHPDIYDVFLKEKIQKDIVYNIKLYIEAYDVELLQSMLSYIILITDNSESMCEAFIHTDLPSLLIEQTIFYSAEDFRLELPKAVTADDIVVQLVIVMHNITRHNRFQQEFIQNSNTDKLKSKLMPYLRCKDKRMCILTMALLIWLSEDDGRNNLLLNLHVSIIVDFTDYIIKGMKDKVRCYEGLFVWELLLVLQALSCMNSIDNNIFMTAKFMKMIQSVLTSKSSLPQEIEIAMGIVWNLSFDKTYREKLKTEFKIENSIKELLYLKNDKIRDKALDFLWELSDKQEKLTTLEEPLYDVFISYCHAQEGVVKKLVNELKKKYKVWVDSENIKGSGLDDMAEGIETSRIVVMGVSHSYRQSQCCRSEACWAYKLKKPIIPLLLERKYKPNGWLGMMISSESYIDVSNMDNIDTSLMEIEKHIKHKTKDTSDSVMSKGREVMDSHKSSLDTMRPTKEDSLDSASHCQMEIGSPERSEVASDDCQ